MTLVESIKIKLGTPAVDFDLTGIDDEKHSLKDYKDAKVLVIAFICNHCPYAQAVWPRLVSLQEKFKDKGVQFVGINPNKNPDYPVEDLPHMKEYAERFNMNFPYLLDEIQDIARAYKAQCTPDIYVFGPDRKLAYHGRVDDNWQHPEKVTRHELEEALSALIEGRPAAEEQFPSMGCSIKWLD
jgi:peroxiredoxin